MHLMPGIDAATHAVDPRVNALDAGSRCQVSIQVSMPVIAGLGWDTHCLEAPVSA